jgi:hypothetical protein
MNIVSSPGYHEEIDSGGIKVITGKLQKCSSQPHRESQTEKSQDFAKMFRATQQKLSQ